MKIQSEETVECSQLVQKRILCSQRNESVSCCESPSCQKYAFTCADKQCVYQKNHSKCLKLTTQTIITYLYSKVGQTKQLQNHIEQMIWKSIDELSKLKDDMINRINKELKYFSLSKEKILLIKAIEQNNIKQITGKKIWKTIHQVFNEQLIQQQIKNFQKTMDEIWKREQITIPKLKQQMFKELEKMEKVINRKTTISDENKDFFKESDIVLDNQAIENIKAFFKDKIIKSTKLLYKASQNDFLASRFHQKCDNVPHTLTLVETEFGKIIGGYTPIIWNKVNNTQTSDPQKRSFLFSLTNNQKLTINPQQNNQCQIHCYASYGPIFGGGCDLKIYDKANQNSNSYANIGKTYVHNNYSSNNKQSWKRFSGAVSCKNFKIKQWQVYCMQMYQLITK